MRHRHNVFVSCYYGEDGDYKEYLEDMAAETGIFIDRSVQEYDIDDRGLSSEQIRKIIRDRKNGVGACGGNCSSCQACHFHPADKKKP